MGNFLNVAVSRTTNSLFLKDREYNIVGIEGQVLRIECDIKGKTVLVGLDDTDFTFVFNKDKNCVLSTYDWYRGLG